MTKQHSETVKALKLVRYEHQTMTSAFDMMSDIIGGGGKACTLDDHPVLLAVYEGKELDKWASPVKCVEPMEATPEDLTYFQNRFGE